jgi:hypothetical protein
MRPLASLLALALTAVPGAAQSFQAALSRDTVPMGEVFELRVRVPVPAGSIVYFPDTVARTEVLESYAPVSWDAEATSGGADLTLIYPVIAWGAGLVPVPGFDVFVSPSGPPPPDAPALPGGSAIGAWTDAPTRAAQGVQPMRVPRRGVWVPPVFGEEQMEAGAEPMPPADVVGSSWHWPSIALGLLFAAAVVALGVREWRRATLARASRSVGATWTPAASRRDALEQLDALLAERLAAGGRTHELYTRSSAIVRRFVGRMDPALGPDLTSSEVLGRLEGRTNGLHGHALFRELGTAEVVKFGRARPGMDEADTHIRSLRGWIAACGDSL